jgi:hypothetical protein
MYPARFCTLAFALTAMSAQLPTLAAVNGSLPTVPASASTDRDSIPPHFPDALHVFNGCHLSTLAYLARFRAEFAGEQAVPFIVPLANLDGVTRSHTIAMVSWRGVWWCRDEYFGVFPIGCRVEPVMNRRRLEDRLKRTLPVYARAALQAPGKPRPPVVPAHLSAELRLREVVTATKILSGAGAIFWIQSGAERIPVVFFRAGGRAIGVYDPARGTCAAETDSPNDAAIVAAAARQVGYRVDSVGAE